MSKIYICTRDGYRYYLDTKDLRKDVSWEEANSLIDEGAVLPDANLFIEALKVPEAKMFFNKIHGVIWLNNDLGEHGATIYHTYREVIGAHPKNISDHCNSVVFRREQDLRESIAYCRMHYLLPFGRNEVSNEHGITYLLKEKGNGTMALYISVCRGDNFSRKVGKEEALLNGEIMTLNTSEMSTARLLEFLGFKVGRQSPRAYLEAEKVALKAINTIKRGGKVVAGEPSSDIESITDFLGEWLKYKLDGDI